MDKKTAIGISLSLVVIGSIFLTIGLIWSLYLCILIGVFLIIYNLIGVIICLLDSDTLKLFFFGIGFELLISFLLIPDFRPYKNTRFITEQGEKQHIYVDCPTIIHSYNIKEVSKLEGLVRFKGSDCKVCKERELDELDEEY